METCYHCGNEVVEKERIVKDDKVFCCFGCEIVYDILSENDMTDYYSFEKNPGLKPQTQLEKFQYLDNEDIVNQIIDFKEGEVCIVHLYIPQIHCSSCIWVLEHLHKLNANIGFSQVEFSKKTVTIHFNPDKISLKEIVLLLCKLGYEPYISLDKSEKKVQWIDRSLIYKIGVAFFGFGNIMLLSFPEYFGVEDFWMDKYRNFFRYLNVILATPVFFYSASPYFISAYHSIKRKELNIDIPMALGILVMFVRSLVDIFILDGAGFLDSMCGLVFFMLSGKLIQQTTYNFLSFERDYKSYFPLAVVKLENEKEIPVQVYDVKEGDRLLIRNEELIPVDAVLISEKAYIDYSFVTGEAVPVEKKAGEKIFAGGKQVGTAIEIVAKKSVSQSYLTELWSNDIFQKKTQQQYLHITDRASKIFTPILLVIALLGLICWTVMGTWVDAFNVFTAVLIVACPCAIALTAPYTWGNVIRIMGRKKMYLKNTVVIEQLSKVNTLVFDKTGTLTTTQKEQIHYKGKALTTAQQADLKSVVRASNHPLSRRLYNHLPESVIQELTIFEELPGKGIRAKVGEKLYEIGSVKWLKKDNQQQLNTSTVCIVIDGQFIGEFTFESQYRTGLKSMLNELKVKGYELHLLSGDNAGELAYLQREYPEISHCNFDQKPMDKLEYVKNLQVQGKNVCMIGDGLNDAGALAQSNVGISISENINVFTPASDAILDATVFGKLPNFLDYSKNAMKIIGRSYVLAIMYNIVGISFALSGYLSPLVAAIIMPLSTATVIGFVSFSSWIYGRKV
ncbi:heavy metal translocating P-type ATPase [Capnocytophaga sp. ARDL2]|uniref:heavy metal translocating P-type ATPase n=1 Tax=Capnocytophaga sp. ARDL2 TaxID=3238809 RepID=UPI003558D4F3